jgi:4-nitrophenyl phosphatase/NagD protein
MLENVSGKKPIFIGKPSPLMPSLAMEKCGVSPDETAVIGDRIYTDIKSGIAAGAHSILVLSGETTVEILNASEDKPELVLNDCGEIIPAIK